MSDIFTKVDSLFVEGAVVGMSSIVFYIFFFMIINKVLNSIINKQTWKYKTTIKRVKSIVLNTLLFVSIVSQITFMKDLSRKKKKKGFKINGYIKNLPVVNFSGKEYRFINGVGFGIDGVVCAEGDRLRAKGKKVNYTALAVKCLLKFKPVNAEVTIDGVTKSYKKVWMTTAMKGRFFGGGMIIAPDQKRDSDEGEISVLVAHNLSRFKILTLFPSIFKGKHTKYTKYIDLVKCHNITVKYDRPCALQMDGEPTFGITEYTATTKTKESVVL